MVRIGRLAILAAVACAAGGCSSVFAAVGRPTDLTVLRQGASREEVECELGRPRSERLLDNGVAATYRVRVGERRSPAENAATVVGSAAQAVRSVGPTQFDTFVGVLVALPTALLTDVILSTREISRLARGRRELTVYYDDLGYVLRFTDPVRR
jgi:hypothetical protein